MSRPTSRTSKRSSSIEIRAWQNADSTATATRRLSTSTNEIQAYKNIGRLTTNARKFHRPSTWQSSPHYDQRDGPSYVGSRGDREVASPRRRSRQSTLWKNCLLEEIDEENPLMDNAEFTRQHSSHPFAEQFNLSCEIFGIYFNAKCSGCLLDSITEKDKEYSFVSTASSYLNMINGTMPWVSSFIGDIQNIHVSTMFSHLDWILRGFGQIFYCNSTLSGLLVLIAISIESSRLAIYAFVAVFSATMSAKLFGFESSLIASGLFGYNAGLIGLALPALNSLQEHTGYSYGVTAAVIVQSMMSIIVFVALSKVLLPYNCPPMTLPFDILCSMLLLASFGMANMDFDVHPTLPEHNMLMNDEAFYGINLYKFVLITLRGVGQIVFSPNICSCVLLVISMAVCSWRIAAYSLLGSALGSTIAILAGISLDNISRGVYGYCPALTFVATMMFYVPSTGAYVLAFVGVVGTTILQSALTTQLGISGIPVSSFPFSFSIIILVLIQGDITTLAVPLESLTVPEDHIRRVEVLRQGFSLLLDAIHRQREWLSPNKGDRRSRMSSLTSTGGSLRLKSTKNLLQKMNRYNTFDESSHDSGGDENDIDRCACDLFDIMDEDNKGSITEDQFKKLLLTIGLTDEEGQSAAVAALLLFASVHPIDQSIELSEWKAFCRGSVELRNVHELLYDFFSFVDTDDDGYVEFDELNDALIYLGKPGLRTEEQKIISRISQSPEEFSVDDLVVFVSAEMLKKFVEHEIEHGSTSW